MPVPPDPEQPRVSRYFRAVRRRDRAIRTAAALFEGVWLGLLDDEHLDRVDQAFFASAQEELAGRGAAYTSSAWNAQGLFDWEQAAIAEQLRPGARIAVTGAGGGREVRGLLDLGYDAVGFEPNPDLVAAGAAQLESAGWAGRLTLHDRRELPLPPGERFDGLVVGWGSYMLVAGTAQRVALLEHLAAHLPPGAPVLLSFWSRAMSPHGRPRLSATVANGLRRLRRREPVEVGDALHPNRLHTFTDDELRREVQQAGLSLQQVTWEPFPHAVALVGP